MGVLTRKIAISILTLTLTIIALTTTTFAWFTLATSNTVDGIQLNVTLGDDLELSLDNISYYQSLSRDMIDEIIKQLKLVDVTSLDGIGFSKRSSSGGLIENADYISLTLYFRTLNPRLKYVYLSNNISDTLTYQNAKGEGTFFVANGVNWQADVTFVNDELGNKVERGLINRYYASDALRVSFLEQIVDTFDERDESTLIKTIYDPSGNPLRGFGMPYGAIAYSNAKGNQPSLPPTTIPDVIYNLSTIKGGLSDNPNSKVSALLKMPTEIGYQQYYVGKTTIKLWLEGWDADCFDAILKDQIKIQLQFQAATN